LKGVYGQESVQDRIVAAVDELFIVDFIVGVVHAGF